MSTTQELVERLEATCGKLSALNGDETSGGLWGALMQALPDIRAAASRLSEMEAAINKIEAHLSDYIETHKTVDVSIAVAYETARAALEHQQKGEGL